MEGATNSSLAVNPDIAWKILGAIVVFIMQIGFGLLESGCATRKNETALLCKNMGDFMFNGFAYWMVGYAFSFGECDGNGFIGCSDFFTDLDSGWDMAKFFFQWTFSATAATISSGALAERCRLSAYIVFSFWVVIIYSISVHWVWGGGWLDKLGFRDFAGGSLVHVLGGAGALVGAVRLGPRYGRFASAESEHQFKPGNPTNVLLGTMFLFVGWFGFNGCSADVQTDGGLTAARSVVNTALAGMAGGILGFVYPGYTVHPRTVGTDEEAPERSTLGSRLIAALQRLIAFSRTDRSTPVPESEAVSFDRQSERWLDVLRDPFSKSRIVDVLTACTGILGGLVSVTAGAPWFAPWASIVVALIGALISLSSANLLVRIKVDDPVGAAAVHCFAGLWGCVAVGLFARDGGLFYGGGWRSLGVQTLGAVAVLSWGTVMQMVLFIVIDRSIGMRVRLESEIVGSDVVCHGVHWTVAIERAAAGRTLDEKMHKPKAARPQGESTLRQRPGISSAFGTFASSQDTLPTQFTNWLVDVEPSATVALTSGELPSADLSTGVDQEQARGVGAPESASTTSEQRSEHHSQPVSGSEVPGNDLENGTNQA